MTEDLKTTSEDREDYLLVTSSGTLQTLEDWQRLDEMSWAEISSSSHRNVVLDEREVTHHEDAFMVADLVQHMMDDLPDSLKAMRIAVLVNAQSEQIARFWETYSVNRGYNFRVFTDEAQAINYVNQ